MLRLLVVIAFFLISSSYGYDTLLLETQSAVLPKIISLTKDGHKRIAQGEKIVAVCYAKGDEMIAKEVAEKITFRGRELGLRGVPYNYAQLEGEHGIVALFILSGTPAQIEKAAKIAESRQILSFAYDLADLEYGALLSLVIERRAIIYLRREAQKSARGIFQERFFDVVRFY
ncbi:MAG: hypothetical protein K6347_07445 [Campylobacterales bacterium]